MENDPTSPRAFQPGKPRNIKRRRTAARLPLLLTAAAVLFFAGSVVWMKFGALYWRSLPYTIQPQGIIVHHSALGNGRSMERGDAALIDRIHQQRGFGVEYRGRTYHIGYHYVILPDGTIQSGRPERCVGAHALGFNDRLGICLVGNFMHTPPTQAQMKSLKTLTQQLMSRYGLKPSDVLRHRDCRHTACPGDRFPFADLQRAISQ